jgi:putative glutamine amidotransferase
MKTIATWIRPVDEALFAAAFAFAPDIRLVNARTTKTDVASADALLLTGGGDIGADYLKQTVPDASLVRGTDAPRDAWEFAAVAPFITSGRPILAICRGHQVLNVVLGGTLLLDIPGHADLGQKDKEVQPLRHADGVPDYRRFTTVNSSHHQAVDRLGDGLVAEAWCATDGIVEQVCDRTHPWCVGVQYHPERSPSYASLFKAFVDAMG